MQLRIDWSTSHHVDDDEDVVLHSLVDAALDAGPVLLLARDRKTKALEPKLFENVQWYLGNLALQRGELAGEWWAGVVRDQPEIGNSDALPALYHLKRLLQ